MTTMKAARIHAPGEVRLDEVDLPEVGPRDILVKVANCGICGSDLSYLKLGGLPTVEKPMPIGHEFAGVIEKVGAEVTAFAPGIRVVVNPEAVANGIGSTGNRGAFAPYVLVCNAQSDPGAVIRLPDDMAFETAALIEPLAVGMHGINQGRVTPQDKVAIFGAGPIGLCAAIVARYYGAQDVVVVDLSEQRLAVAQQLGMVTCKADEQDVSSVLRKTHGKVKHPLLGKLPATDVFIEATGSAPVFQQIIELGKQSSRVVVVGVHFQPAQLNLLKLLTSEMRISAAYAYPTEFPDVVNMLTQGQVDVSPLISHRYPLSQFTDAITTAQDANAAVKVMVDCQA
jgi:(R,R)-butanediol dehydrogenase / meso-butanediol dehydrogenase / diacetyl reductase